MIDWMKASACRACLTSGLLAALMSFNSHAEAETTIDNGTFAIGRITDDRKVPAEPVVGEVEVLPDTSPKLPVRTRGRPNPIDGFLHSTASKKASRFIEVAPDTADGQTYVSSDPLKYKIGELVTIPSRDVVGFTGGKPLVVTMSGLLRFPQKALNGSAKTERFPIVIFLHGSHRGSSSHLGYDYLAKQLAEHGYVVASIDANLINSSANEADPSSQSRAQLILGTLDRLRQIDGFGQISMGKKKGMLDALKGRLDFSRIGIMGHSRGGEAIANTIRFNLTRRGTTEEDLRAAIVNKPEAFEEFSDLTKAAKLEGDAGKLAFEAARVKYNFFYAAGSGQDSGLEPPYDFKGAFMLAPTDGGDRTELNHVPLANLLPSCDGDVMDLPGARVYDHNRFGPKNDAAPRYQIVVNGANHNYYNTNWESDDFSERYAFMNVYLGPKHCLPEEEQKDSIRLSAEDQRRTGLFIIDSFMRYHVGGEMQFAPYWNGLAGLPEAACPAGRWPCDERIVLTVQKNGWSRMLIHRFDQSDSLKSNAFKRAVTYSGFDDHVRCKMSTSLFTPLGLLREPSCDPKSLSGFKQDGARGLLSVADHVKLVWSKPAALNANAPKREVSMTEDITGISAVGFDSLTFRIAVVQPMGQEVEVTLTDVAGNSATVDASSFSDALYNAPRRKKGGSTPKEEDLPRLDDPADAPYANVEPRILMNMVAIPLKAFAGVDLAHLKELKLAFPKESGKVAITDIELQNFGRARRLTEIALSQAGMAGASGAGTAFGGKAPDNSSSPGEKMLIINH